MCYDQVKSTFLFKVLTEATCMNVAVVFFPLCAAKHPLCQHLRFLNSKSLEETAVYLWALDQGWGQGEARPTAI